jgi:hypothetical protein
MVKANWPQFQTTRLFVLANPRKVSFYLFEALGMGADALDADLLGRLLDHRPDRPVAQLIADQPPLLRCPQAVPRRFDD